MSTCDKGKAENVAGPRGRPVSGLELGNLVLDRGVGGRAADPRGTGCYILPGRVDSAIKRRRDAEDMPPERAAKARCVPPEWIALVSRTDGVDMVHYRDLPALEASLAQVSPELTIIPAERFRDGTVSLARGPPHRWPRWYKRSVLRALAETLKKEGIQQHMNGTEDGPRPRQPAEDLLDIQLDGHLDNVVLPEGLLGCADCSDHKLKDLLPHWVKLDDDGIATVLVSLHCDNIFAAFTAKIEYSPPGLREEPSRWTVVSHLPEVTIKEGDVDLARCWTRFKERLEVALGGHTCNGDREDDPDLCRRCTAGDRQTTTIVVATFPVDLQTKITFTGLEVKQGEQDKPSERMETEREDDIVIPFRDLFTEYLAANRLKPLGETNGPKDVAWHKFHVEPLYRLMPEVQLRRFMEALESGASAVQRYGKLPYPAWRDLLAEFGAMQSYACAIAPPAPATPAASASGPVPAAPVNKASESDKDSRLPVRGGSVAPAPAADAAPLPLTTAIVDAAERCRFVALRVTCADGKVIAPIEVEKTDKDGYRVEFGFGASLRDAWNAWFKSDRVRRVKVICEAARLPALILLHTTLDILPGGQGSVRERVAQICVEKMSDWIKPVDAQLKTESRSGMVDGWQYDFNEADLLAVHRFFGGSVKRVASPDRICYTIYDPDEVLDQRLHGHVEFTWYCSATDCDCSYELIFLCTQGGDGQVQIVKVDSLKPPPKPVEALLRPAAVPPAPRLVNVELNPGPPTDAAVPPPRIQFPSMRRQQRAIINRYDYAAIVEFERRHPNLFVDARAPVSKLKKPLGYTRAMADQMNAFNVIFEDERWGNEFKALIDELKGIPAAPAAAPINPPPPVGARLRPAAVPPAPRLVNVELNPGFAVCIALVHDPSPLRSLLSQQKALLPADAPEVRIEKMDREATAAKSARTFFDAV